MVEVALQVRKDPYLGDPVRVRRRERAWPVVMAAVMDGPSPVPLDGMRVSFEVLWEGGHLSVPCETALNVAVFALPQEAIGARASYLSIEGEGLLATTQDLAVEVVG